RDKQGRKAKNKRRHKRQTRDIDYFNPKEGKAGQPDLVSESLTPAQMKQRHREIQEANRGYVNPGGSWEWPYEWDEDFLNWPAPIGEWFLTGGEFDKPAERLVHKKIQNRADDIYENEFRHSIGSWESTSRFEAWRRASRQILPYDSVFGDP